MTVSDLLRVVDHSVPMEIWLICRGDCLDDRNVCFRPIHDSVGMYGERSIPSALHEARVLDIRIMPTAHKTSLYVAADIEAKLFIECLWEKHKSRRFPFNDKRLLSERVSDDLLASFGWDKATIEGFRRECTQRCIR